MSIQGSESWFTSGRRHPREGSYVIVDQAYVQQRGPGREQGRPPIVFVHGGGLTGAVWESTPDRRPGWAARAAAAGWPVAVVDGVDAGRSGRAPDEVRGGEEEWKTAAQTWSRYRIGTADGWGARRPFPGQQFPVHALDALLASHAVRRRTTAAAETAALAEVVARLGPCHVIAHSYGASLVARAYQDLAGDLLRVVLLEPSPFDVEAPLPPERALLVWGDHFATTDEPTWAGAPEAYRASSAAGLDLTAAGLPGASHVMMADRSSDAVLDLVLGWLAA